MSLKQGKAILVNSMTAPHKQLTNLQGQRTDDNVMHQAVNA